MPVKVALAKSSRESKKEIIIRADLKHVRSVRPNRAANFRGGTFLDAKNVRVN